MPTGTPPTDDPEPPPHPRGPKLAPHTGTPYRSGMRILWHLFVYAVFFSICLLLALWLLDPLPVYARVPLAIGLAMFFEFIGVLILGRWIGLSRTADDFEEEGESR